MALSSIGTLCLFLQCGPQAGSPQPVLLHGVGLLQSLHLPLLSCRGFVSPFLQPVEFPLNSIPTLWRYQLLSKLGGDRKLSESTFCFMILDVDEDATMLAPNQTLPTWHQFKPM